MEWLIEKHREGYLEHQNVSEQAFLKRRIITTIIITLLYMVVLFSMFNIWLLLLTPVVIFFGYKLPYFELLKVKKREDLVKEHMFPTFLRYFISLINIHGNVYQTLKATVPYMKDPLKSELINLVEKMDDKNYENFHAFTEFADFVGSAESHMIMDMIHQFDEEGIKKSSLEELELTVKKLQENKISELIDLNVTTVDKHADPVLVYSLIYVISFTIILFVAYFREIPI